MCVCIVHMCIPYGSDEWQWFRCSYHQALVICSAECRSYIPDVRESVFVCIFVYVEQISNYNDFKKQVQWFREILRLRNYAFRAYGICYFVQFNGEGRGFGNEHSLFDSRISSKFLWHSASHNLCFILISSLNSRRDHVSRKCL